MLRTDASLPITVSGMRRWPLIEIRKRKICIFHIEAQHTTCRGQDASKSPACMRLRSWFAYLRESFPGYCVIANASGDNGFREFYSNVFTVAAEIARFRPELQRWQRSSGSQIKETKRGALTGIWRNGPDTTFIRLPFPRSFSSSFFSES